MAAPAPAPAQPAFSLHPSRRPVIYATHGIVACTQPLAAQAGLNILRKGGNAADAAIAAAAVLNVTEPTSTGLGGDVFCLLHHAPTSTLHGINGSGPSPSSLTLQKVLASLPPNHTEWRIPAANPLSVTVPGAAAAWCDIVTRFGSGKVSLREIFDDAIRMAEDGFALSTFAGRWWGECAGVLRGSGREEMLLAGRAPREGEIMRVPELARVLREVAERGRAGFYEGWVAESVVGEVQALGGVLEMEDMAGMGERGSEDVDPVFVEYAGYKLWECAPNGQGLVALMTLGILKALQERGVVGKIGGEGGMQHNSPDYLHVLIECFRIAFTDGRWYITDPRTNPDPTAALLSKAYLHQRSTLFSPTQTNPTHPISPPSLYPCDTTYLSTTDAHGNSCSFTNSLQNGFGTGIVPRGTATPLQNRASSFSLDPDAPNCVAPGKRPYHTIIAGMVTERVPGAAEGEGGEKEGGNGGEGKGKGVKLNGERIKSVMGCMGGLMQPQGHVQLFMNLLVFNMDPQQALDAPRICVLPISFPPSSLFSPPPPTTHHIEPILTQPKHSSASPATASQSQKASASSRASAPPPPPHSKRSATPRPRSQGTRGPRLGVDRSSTITTRMVKMAKRGSCIVAAQTCGATARPWGTDPCRCAIAIAMYMYRTPTIHVL